MKGRVELRDDTAGVRVTLEQPKRAGNPLLFFYLREEKTDMIEKLLKLVVSEAGLV